MTPFQTICCAIGGFVLVLIAFILLLLMFLFGYVLIKQGNENDADIYDEEYGNKKTDSKD